MKLWLLSKLDNLRENFWFVPMLMVAAAVALSWVMVYLDKTTSDYEWIAKLSWTFARGPEGSRAVLATVASSMMTIASVTFSITIVALQLASSQFGPRLLRNFMRDRANQIAIGTFIATFTYCLLVLRTVNGTENEVFVPHMSVIVGLLLALASLGVLIFFIHHSAQSIQVENVISGVSRELHQAIDRLYPSGLGRERGEVAQNAERQTLPPDFEAESQAVQSSLSDYLQAIDVERLLELATEHDLVLSIEQRPGRFLLKGGNLARASPRQRLDDDLVKAIRATFIFGPRRTLTQDVEFAIDQLVEVAVRALSPGINDPFTAINCVDRLAAALCALAEKVIPSPYRCDEQGRLRVVTDASTIAGIVDASFNQIRQAARRDASVTLRLLEAIAGVGRLAPNPALRKALQRQADAIHRGSQDGLLDPADRQEADRRYQIAIASLTSDDPDVSSLNGPA